MRLSSMMWVVVVVVAASLLYSVKYRVQSMDEQIAVLRNTIAEERAAIHVLRAEWAYLSRPERVRKLADMHLDMDAAKGQQMMELADVPYSPESPVRLADGDANMTPYVGGIKSAPTPRMRPGVMPAGGAGYVR